MGKRGGLIDTELIRCSLVVPAVPSIHCSSSHFLALHSHDGKLGGSGSFGLQGAHLCAEPVFFSPRKAQESQKEMKLLLDMYKSAPKEQRDKVQLMAAEKKTKAEVRHAPECPSSQGWGCVSFPLPLKHLSSSCCCSAAKLWCTKCQFVH